MKKKQNKNSHNLVKIFSLVILALVMVQIFVSHRLATAGKLVGELESQATRISAENVKLREIINNKGSLAAVYEKAQHLGFKPVDNIYYLTSEIPVALGF